MAPGQRTAVCRLLPRQHRCRERRAGGDQTDRTPVPRAAHQRVVEVVRPVLQLERRAVRRAPQWRVEPHSRRPPGARPHQRQVQRARRIDGEAGQAVVDQADGVVVEQRRVGGVDGGGRQRRVGRERRRGLAHALRGVLRPIPRDDQHRQGAHVPQVGVRHPRLLDRHLRRDEEAGVSLVLEQPVELLPDRGIAVFEDLGGERVGVRAADHDADVGQVGVDVQPPVPRPLGRRGGRGDADPGQRDHQLAHGVGVQVQVVGDDFGDRDGDPAEVGAGFGGSGIGIGIGIAARIGIGISARDVAQAKGRGAAEGEERVRRIVQRPRRDRDVRVGQRETTADDGTGDLGDRPRTGDVARELHAQQPVRAGEVQDAGAEIDAVQTVVKGDALLVLHVADGPGDDVPPAQR